MDVRRQPDRSSVPDSVRDVVGDAPRPPVAAGPAGSSTWPPSPASASTCRCSSWRPSLAPDELDAARRRARRGRPARRRRRNSPRLPLRARPSCATPSRRRSPARRRARLHLDLAEAIETAYEADRRPVLAELARHFAAAAPVGRLDKAVYYGRRAAAQAMRAAAYDEAVAHLHSRARPRPARRSSAPRCSSSSGTVELRRASYEASRDACLEAFRDRHRARRRPRWPPTPRWASRWRCTSPVSRRTGRRRCSAQALDDGRRRRCRRSGPG